MAVEKLVQTLLFILLLFALPTTAHTPQKQYIAPIKPIAKQAEPIQRKVMFDVSAYTASDDNMRGDGITASQRKAIPWRTVASSRHYPIGTRIYFPQIKRTVVVYDRFASAKKEKELKIPANRIDLYVGIKNRKEALQFGRRKMEGVILE